MYDDPKAREKGKLHVYPSKTDTDSCCNIMSLVVSYI